jgi:hypothetical protein
MSTAALNRAARVIRLSYSQILRLRRCPWAWHARHVRELVPLTRRRAPPAWGDAYHAAAAEVWCARARLEQSGHWLDGRDLSESTGLLAATVRLQELDVPGLDAEALAAEAAQAAVEVCRFVGPEWRVLWLGGEPVVERHLVVPVGEVSGPERVCEQCDGDGLESRNSTCHRCRGSGMSTDLPVELVAVLDLALVHRETGVVRVVDHKSTSSWPEQTGDALHLTDDLDMDLRDDLQVRLYVLALRHALAAQRRTAREEADRCARFGGDIAQTSPLVIDATLLALAPMEGAHLVRRASVGTEPPRLKRGSLSRAQNVEATEEQWRRAIRRAGLREEDYEAELARARLTRWHAWAPVDFNARSLEQARREVLWAAEEVARFRDRNADDVPRHHRPGRWQPSRPQKWAGLHPKTGAEAHHWDACQACDHRELCEAELRGEDSALVALAEFAHADDEREARKEGLLPSCEFDVDEVE